MAYFHCLIGGGSSGGGYTLTVTCDSQFAGTTITCTDGVTTLTATCPSASPYEVEFDIPNGGDWTISGVVSGQTVTTGVSIPTTAELVAILQQTITIYSAKEDTVTYTDIYGDTQTEVFASGQTSKQITVDIDPSGSSITFTSGVAKDPSDLASDYSKTVTITSNTTEIYLMPDNVVYWYGYINGTIELSTANGWSGSTFNAPTYSTNYMTFTSPSSQFSGIYCQFNANKTLKFISEGVTAYSGTYVRYRTVTDKSFSNGANVSDISSATKAVHTGTYVANLYGILHTFGNGGMSTKIWAVWAE